MPLAAVPHQEGDEIGQGWEDDAVDDRAAFPTVFNKARMFEMAQVERKAGRRTADSLTDGPGGHAVRTNIYESPDNAEADFVRDRREGVESSLFLHFIKTFQERLK